MGRNVDLEEAFSLTSFSQSGNAQYFWSDKHVKSSEQHAARQD